MSSPSSARLGFPTADGRWPTYYVLMLTSNPPSLSPTHCLESVDGHDRLHSKNFRGMTTMVRDRLSVLLAPILLALMSPSHVSAADIAGLQQMYDGAMLPDIAVATFSQTERLLPVRIVHRGGSPRPLPRRAEPFPKIRFEDHGRSFDLYDYLATNRVAGLLVLKDGKIAL